VLGHDAFGNVTSVTVKKSSDGSSWSSGKTLASYIYGPSVNNGLLTQLLYGNGNSISYSYDMFDRVIQQSYNDNTKYHYVYDAEGQLTNQFVTIGSDTTPTDSYTFEYDSLGRVIRSKQTSGTTLVQRTQHIYDTANRIISQTWQLGSQSFSESYSYSANDGCLTSMGTAAGTTIGYTYDPLKRLTSETTTVGGGSNLFHKDYTYRNIDDTRTTTQVENFAYKLSSDNSVLAGYSYTYNALGNISKISDSSSGNPLVIYTYDSQEQLLSETYYDGQGSGDSHISATYTYTYDTAGNLLTSSDGTTTHNYSYADTDSEYDWADLLTSYDGNSLTYDAIGNPLTYNNGSSYTMTWAKGRQLTTVTSGGTTTSYTYDMDGIRQSKTVGGVTTNYITQNGQVVRQTWGGNTLDFIYDSNEKPYALIYTPSGGTATTYYYVLNLQGDVVALLNSGSSVIARYTYNAWGKLLSVTDANGAAITDRTNIAVINPLRFRGYYYDTETGFYYLQSRYYDPMTGRFINADGLLDFMGQNLFAYCCDDPVNYIDDDGNRQMEATNPSEETKEERQYSFQEANSAEPATVSDNFKFTESNTTSTVFSTVTGVVTIVTGTAMLNTSKPANIGAGTWLKFLKQAESETNGVLDVFSTIFGAVAIGLDVCYGVEASIKSGNSTGKILWDAGADAVCTGGSMAASIVVTDAAIGFAGGSLVPGAGNVIGGVAGIIAGFGTYLVTEVFGGREWLKGLYKP